MVDFFYFLALEMEKSFYSSLHYCQEINVDRLLFNFWSTYFRTRHCQMLRITFSGLEKVAIFTTNVDAENQCLMNHKCVCGALNRHFCQTVVRRSCFSVHKVMLSNVMLCH